MEVETQHKIFLNINEKHFLGNPICGCIPLFIPQGSPVDGCLPPAQYPSSPVILHNRSVETLVMMMVLINVISRQKDCDNPCYRHNLFDYGSITI